MIKDIVSLLWIYQRLICEFDHWDICLSGLINLNDKYVFCKVCDPNAKNVQYKLYNIIWNNECEEYLQDYRIAYTHWFYNNGKRHCPYDGKDLTWFDNKWKHRNPIEDNIRKDAD